jgi:predicted lipoprotein with Yx(FWY)xxD motif
MRRPVIALLPVLLLAACGSARQQDAPTASAATATATATATAEATTSLTTETTTTAHRQRHKPALAIRVASTQYGHALVDRRGFALYLFTHDPRGATTCHGACAAAWPPYLVTTRHLAAQGEARTALVGTIRRPDGHLQVTYRGHPLYYYVGDRQPHQVLCQAVAEFGGTWYVVAPGGSPIR